MLTACRVLTHFRIVEGFGHVSVRIAGTERILITLRRALGLVTEAELVEVDLAGGQVAGEGSPPLEAAMHLAIYRRRADVMAIARGHPRMSRPSLAPASRFAWRMDLRQSWSGGTGVPRSRFLSSNTEMADGVADALGDGEAVILQSNGMLAVGQTVPHACVQALFLEETAELQLRAQAADLTPRYYTPEDAARRHGDDRVHEPVRAWEYYVAAAAGKSPAALSRRCSPHSRDETLLALAAELLELGEHRIDVELVAGLLRLLGSGSRGAVVVTAAGSSVAPCASSRTGFSLAARCTSKSRSICVQSPSVTGSSGCRLRGVPVGALADRLRWSTWWCRRGA